MALRDLEKVMATTKQSEMPEVFCKQQRNEKTEGSRKVGVDKVRLKTPTEGSVPQGGPEDTAFTEAIRKALVNRAPASLSSEVASSAGQAWQ